MPTARLSFSMEISRWSSPIPLRIVSFVSSSVCVFKVGSSRTRRLRASPTLPWSSSFENASDCAITGFGNWIASSATGLSGSLSVFPVNVSARPIAATMSPGPAFSSEIRLSPIIR